MSRSKRQAVFTQGYGSPGKRIDKRMASRAVRNYTGEIPSGNAYKKIFDSWNICDWHFDHRWQVQGDWVLMNYHMKIINGRYYQNK